MLAPSTVAQNKAYWPAPGQASCSPSVAAGRHPGCGQSGCSGCGMQHGSPCPAAGTLHTRVCNDRGAGDRAVPRPSHHLRRVFWCALRRASSRPQPFKKPLFFCHPLQLTGISLRSLQDECFAIAGKDSVPEMLRNHESACSREGGGGEEISFYDESSHTSCCFCFGHTGSEAVGCFLPGSQCVKIVLSLRGITYLSWYEVTVSHAFPHLEQKG